MKTIKTISMMLALTVIANIALATGNLKVNILPLTSERAVISITNNLESKFEISVETDSGNILYYNQTNESDVEYNKVYDFSKLETGDYKLVVNINGELTQREFTISNNQINVGQMKSIIKPFFSFNDDVLRVAYLNYQNDKIKLSVYDNGQAIFSKVLKDTFSVNEALSLSKLEDGDYTIVLSAGDESYNYTVGIE